MNPATMKPFHLVFALLGLASGPGTLRADPAYPGRPFDDAAYRAEQDREARLPRAPYHAFSTALAAWDAMAPDGSGWVGREEPSATIRLDDPDGSGRRVIHYHVALGNYRYAAFGWKWGKDGDKPIDLTAYDAVSFSIRVTGPQRPQELFFGVTEFQPAPLSLRDYDPDFTDGSWHRITIPARAMKWTGPIAVRKEVRGFAFMTFVWDPADFDVQLDQFTFDRAVAPSAPEPQAAPEAGPPARGQAIPGRVECAFYDLGGEGVAYHDTTPINILSGVLNQQRRHQRAHATAYYWNFRRDEGVDISFVKDWADLNHPNLVDPPVNQLYIGGTEDGEWCNYTVDVKKSGAYEVVALYGNVATAGPVTLSIDGKPACACTFPAVTGSMHKWNRAPVGQITFAYAGVHVLTLHYSRGYNLGYFEFVEVQ